jgi:hypothetical protein
MVSETKDRIEEYIKKEYTGGLIGISILTDFCKKPTWDIYLALKSLESQGKIKIIKRYVCPKIDVIPNDKVPFCPRCGIRYAMTDITTTIYVEPISIEKENSTILRR